MRILRPDGSVAKNAACFDESAATLWTESANSVHAVAVCPDDKYAAAGTEDGRLWLFRLPDRKLGGQLAHADRVTAAAFDATGQWLASGSRDRVIRLWRRDGENYRPNLTLRSPGAGPVSQLVFAEGDRLLALHDRESAVRVWHLNQLATEFASAGLGH
jgi:eukaryotic-like serine/threonine-protein kinase